MKATKFQIGLTLFTPIYLLMVLFTDISLTGYWTDIIFSILLVSTSLIFVQKPKIDDSWIAKSLRRLTLLSALLVFGLLGVNLINPFSWNTFKMSSFYYQEVEGRLFNAYFVPVGAYAGGEGNFWITETSLYYPLIEIEKYSEQAILWNFSNEEFDGQAVDQEQVVASYIRKEILEKENQ